MFCTFLEHVAGLQFEFYKAATRKTPPAPLTCNRVTIDANGNALDSSARGGEDADDGGGGEASSPTATGSSGHGAGLDVHGVDALVYSDFDLTCPTRKAAQSWFLRHKVVRPCTLRPKNPEP